MATRFLSRVLTLLDTVYGFVGGQVTADRIDLRAPIQLVHDVRRESEIGAVANGQKLAVPNPAGLLILEGYTTVEFTNTHAVAAGDVYTDTTTQATWDALIGNPAYWAWIVELAARAHNSLTVVEAGFTLTRPPQMASANFVSGIIGRWTGMGGVPIVSGGTTSPLIASSGLPYVVNLPIWVPPGSELVFWSDASGAAQAIRAQAVLWIGPAGVLPPGLA